LTKLFYFARVRQMVGKGEEEIELPASLATVSDVVAWLKARDAAYANAFSDMRVIRAAVDQSHKPLDASIRGAREIAFFPPVTGG
jgi:molybdopterin synthase sulfur carrier subunit